MAAVFGKIEEFDSEKGLAQLRGTITITTGEQKLAVFLSVIGPTTYKLTKPRGTQETRREEQLLPSFKPFVTFKPRIKLYCQ